MSFKYAGTTQESTPADRLEDDAKAAVSSRFVKLTSTGGARAWSLIDVDDGVHSHIEWRANPVVQDVERALIFLGGPGGALCNSASGGFQSRWLASPEMATAVADALGAAGAGQGTTSTVNKTPERAEQLLRHFQESLELLSLLPAAKTGFVISKASVIKAAIGMGMTAAEKGATSMVLLDDITKEEAVGGSDGVNFFGAAAGPGPMLEQRQWDQLDAIEEFLQQAQDADGAEASLSRPVSSARPESFHHRYYIDFWPFCLGHNLFYLHALFLLRSSARKARRLCA